MDYSDFKLQLNEWKSKNEDFYYDIIRVFKARTNNFKLLMHVYIYGIQKLPYHHIHVKLRQIENVFGFWYHISEKLGADSILGMAMQVLNNNFFMFMKCRPVLLENAIAYWVLVDSIDFHSCIIGSINNYSNKNNYLDSLRQVEMRIIKNSILLGLCNDDFWKMELELKHLLLLNSELESLVPDCHVPSTMVSISENVELNVKLNIVVNDKSALADQCEIKKSNAESLLSTGETEIKANPQSEPNAVSPLEDVHYSKNIIRNTPGAKKHRYDNWTDFFKDSPCENRKDFIGCFKKEIKGCNRVEQVAALTFALEYLGIVGEIKKERKLCAYFDLLKRYHVNVGCYRTFGRYYNFFDEVRVSKNLSDLKFDAEIKEKVLYYITIFKVFSEPIKTNQNY